jgi:hypothetical protein
MNDPTSCRDWLARRRPPAGATGLLRRPGESMSQQVARREAGWISFSWAVYAAARATKTRVGGRLPQPRAARSYSGLTVHDLGRDVEVLFHWNLHVLAVAEPETALDWPFPALPA